jgi:DNA-binding PadR family transcriptional regulator
MCKPFPLFRCTDDTEKKVIKLSTQSRNKEKELGEVDELMTQLRNDLPEGEIENDAAYTALKKQREKILVDVAAIDEKKKHELLQYAATAGGQKELEAKAQDETVPPFERMEAAAEKAAAAERRMDQKEMAKILSSSNLTAQEKALYAEQEINSAERTMFGLKKRMNKNRVILAELQDEILLAREEKDYEGLKELVAQRDQLLTEISYVDKRIKQKLIKQQELKRWLGRLYKQSVHMNFRFGDQMITGIFKLI